MYVNCSLYLLQLSSAQKWKNLHLKQCCRSVMLTSKELPFLLKQILKMEFKSILLYIVSPCRKDGIADINPHRPADKITKKHKYQSSWCKKVRSCRTHQCSQTSSLWACAHNCQHGACVSLAEGNRRCFTINLNY